MQASVEITPAGHILYDPAQVASAPTDWFEPQTLAASGRLLGSETGRGTTWLFTAGDRELVLRHYRRGGAVARLLHDRYPRRALAATRAWREWQLLRQLHELGLPVPRPAAARVVYSGLFYRCDLVTHRIANACSLTQRLSRRTMRETDWTNLGSVIARFHHHGVYHADLNAQNILFQDSGAVYLIDFDRGRIRPQGPWQADNLQRLQRSLHKIRNRDPGIDFEARHWSLLSSAYRAEPWPTPSPQ